MYNSHTEKTFSYISSLEVFGFDQNRVPTAQGKQGKQGNRENGPKKFPVRENTGNLKILLKKHKENTGNFLCSSCNALILKVKDIAIFAAKR